MKKEMIRIAKLCSEFARKYTAQKKKNPFFTDLGIRISKENQYMLHIRVSQFNWTLFLEHNDEDLAVRSIPPSRLFGG